MRKITKKTILAGVATLSIALLAPALIADNGRGRDRDRHRDRDRDRRVEQRDRGRDHRHDHRVDRRQQRQHDRRIERRQDRRIDRRQDRRFDRRDQRRVERRIERRVERRVERRLDRRYDRLDRRQRRYHRFDRNRFDRFRIPTRIIDVSYDSFSPYFQRRAYFPLHNHRHEIFLFPVLIDGHTRWREHAYCNGDLFNAHGRIFYDGPRFSVSLGF